MKYGKTIVTGICVMLVIIGCGLPLNSPTGSMVLMFDNALGERTIAPELDMEPAEYAVDGFGPGSATFSEVFTPPAGVLEHLVPGSWTVQVTARNGDLSLIHI